MATIADDQKTKTHNFVLKNSTFDMLQDARNKYIEWYHVASGKKDIPSWDELFFTLLTFFSKSPYARVSSSPVGTPPTPDLLNKPEPVRRD